MTIRILELYPAHLSLNGDIGNCTALARRMRLAGIEVDEIQYHPGDELPAEVDIVTIGTGTSSAQRSIAADIERIAPTLRAWSESGVVIVAAGAGFHLLAQSVRLGLNETIPGAGVFAGAVDSTAHRVITEAFALDSEHGLLIGTENHTASYSSRPDQRPLGQVRNGIGNGDGTDGAIVHNSYGTHCHGPALVLNPVLTDHLIGLAVARSGGEYAKNERHDELDRVIDLARNILIAKLPTV